MSKKKYVDESWKENAFVEADKIDADSKSQTEATQKGEAVEENQSSLQPKAASDKSAQQESNAEVNFLNYITSLGFQAMIFMGEIPNPMSNKVEKNLTQAKLLIDTLLMLKEKTTRNLNDQESQLLENSVYELQMKYVQVTQSDTEAST